MAQGSVVKRSGSWYAVYRVGNKQKWEKAGTSRSAAEKLLIRRINDANLGLNLEQPKIRLRDFVQKWIEDYARINVKQSTYIGYLTIIDIHLLPSLGDRWLHSITAGDIQHLISERITKAGLKPKTVVNVLLLLKEILRSAVAWGYLRASPAEHVRLPRVERKEMDFLTAEEVRLLLSAVDPDDYCLILTAVFTGMRRGELLALQWSDIDWNSSEILVRRAYVKGAVVSPKSSHSRRRIVMSPYLRSALEQHRLLNRRRDSELVFCNREGGYIDPENFIKRVFQPALERAGLRRIRFHDLRHTYASLLIAQGENIKFIQQQLGHGSAKTTLDRYGHLMPNRENDAARRLDETVFGDFVRKLLENPASEGSPHKNKSSEVLEPQRANLVAGGGFEPPTFGL